MKLLESDRMWMPQGQEMLWVLVQKEDRPPQTMHEWRVLQAMMLERLIQEAKDEGGDLRYESETLKESPLGGAMFHPEITDPRFPEWIVLDAPTPVESGLAEALWEKLEPVLENHEKVPVNRGPEAQTAAEDLNLQTWLERMG